MADTWVANASPLIILAHIGYIDLLHKIPDRLVIPRTVADEVFSGPPGDPAIEALVSGGFEILDAPQPPPSLIAWDLGKGETAVLSMAIANPGWVSILDDKAARKFAQSYSLPVKGTLAVVINARQREIIPSAGALIQRMTHAGFWLDESFICDVLAKSVEEIWPPE